MPYKMLDFKPAARPQLAVPDENPNSIREDDPRPHLVFLRRKNPAVPGGIQRLSGWLVNGLSGAFDIEQINWFGPEWGVPAYFPFFYFKSIRNGARLVHCDDAVTSLVGARIGRRSGKLVAANVHGLDIILPIPWYQKKLGHSLRTLDKVICISRATARQVEARGVSPDRIEVIPGMAETPSRALRKTPELYRAIFEKTGISLEGKKVLISLGRPVKRKGYDRFISDVFPYLKDDRVYIIAGPKIATPPWINLLRPLLGETLYHNLLLASGAYGMHEDLLRLSRHPRVFYINGVSEELRELLLAAGDLFIMPNRTIAGDMEGFGLVALEAAIRGLPVIATGIEGITDAVIDGQNGLCLAEGNSAGMKGVIEELLENPEALSAFGRRTLEFTRVNFAPEIILGKYERVFNSLLEKSPESPQLNANGR